MRPGLTNYSNILEAIFDHAKSSPDKVAFSYIEGRDIEQISVTSLSYLELYVKAALNKSTRPDFSLEVVESKLSALVDNGFVLRHEPENPGSFP